MPEKGYAFVLPRLRKSSNGRSAVGVTLNLHDISERVIMDDAAVKDENIAFHIAEVINTI